MSGKMIEVVFVTSALAIGAVGMVACGGDEKKTTPGDNSGDGDSAGDGDTGGDASTAGDGDLDSGANAGDTDASTLPPGAVKCGTKVCEALTLTSGPLAGCCVKDADGNDACGLAATNLAGAETAGVECVLRDAPGAESAACGAAWDKIDDMNEVTLAGDAGTPVLTDGLYTSIRKVGGATAISQFNGCCTTAGKCSINFKNPDVNFAGMDYPDVDLGYGCADPALVGLNVGAEAMGFGADGIGCDANSGAITEAPQAPNTSDGGVDGGN
jgi:hypothetical protein